MTEYENLLAGVERLEKMGGLQEALGILQKIKQVFPNQENEIVLRMLNIMFQQERYEEALDTALEYVKNGDGSIFQWCLEQYYEPFREEAENIKRRNLECLERYEYYYGAAEKHTVKALLYDGCEKLVFCEGRTITKHSAVSGIQLENEEIVLISNVIDLAWLAEQIHQTKYNGIVPNYEVPVYLYYDEAVFEALLQCTEMEGLLKDHRTVVLVGEDQFRYFFAQSQARFPHRIISANMEMLKGVLDHQLQVDEQQVARDKAQIETYYSDAKKEIDERIRQKKPRILFVTSYFTSVLKNHARNLRRSAEKMGLDTAIIMEQGSIFSLCHVDEYARLNSFRPDMIICIDHFRFEYQGYPKEIIWVCWTQDPILDVMNPLTPAKLGNRDFVMSHFTTWQEFRDLGYPADRKMDAPIPSNQEIYKPYSLTAEEKERYSCDICLVCHASDVDAHIQRIIGGLPEDKREAIAFVYKRYQRKVYETGEPWYRRELFEQLIAGTFQASSEMQWPDSFLKELADDMYLRFNQRVFREALVDWLLDAGFTNIRLWGNGWKKNPKYAPYAMGPAENGETLSKIYQASKIVVGNNVMTTAAARAWETMLSGGFYLSNYIPEEADITDIRKIVTVGEDVIMFYNRDDLIEKLHYYLEHEDERKIMIEKGRKVALEKMTFDVLIKKMLAEIAAHI